MKAAFRKAEGQQDLVSQGFSTNLCNRDAEISSVCSSVATLEGSRDTCYRLPQNVSMNISATSSRIAFMKSVFS